MSNPIIKIHNAETGEEIEREMTEEELAEFKIDKAKIQENFVKENELLIAKNNLLEKLGITEDEAKLLLS